MALMLTGMGGYLGSHRDSVAKQSLRGPAKPRRTSWRITCGTEAAQGGSVQGPRESPPYPSRCLKQGATFPLAAWLWLTPTRDAGVPVSFLFDGTAALVWWEREWDEMNEME
jgi:hypothetical protein